MNNSAKIFQRLSSGNNITLYEAKMNVLQRETSGGKNWYPFNGSLGGPQTVWR
jgi:hypothetical protein